jgi:rfaE bifunctional protein kinase chain/domain
MVNNSDLLPLIDRLKTARVLCIGDVMLDHYVYGQVERVSPEAPIPVLWIEREMKTLGGAGNVMRNLRALGAASSFISVVGNDEAGREIGRLVEAQDGAEAHVLVQPQRTTTVKTRYVAGNQQLLRADRESAIPLDPYIREDLLRLACELVEDHPVVIISDYGKGVLTEGVALEIIRAATEAGAQVIVDPKGSRTAASSPTPQECQLPPRARSSRHHVCLLNDAASTRSLLRSVRKARCSYRPTVPSIFSARKCARSTMCRGPATRSWPRSAPRSPPASA